MSSELIPKSGFVSIVGAGPGNPDYLTLKGLRLLKNAEVILYDALLDETFSEYFPENSVQIFVGKRKGLHTKTQEEIHGYMKAYFSEGKRIVRLKGGDPFLFGRGAEEVKFLRENNIPYEIVPGVSSMQAASALSEIPLTHRGVSREVLILGGSNEKNRDYDFSFLSEFNGTIVLFMGSEVLDWFCKSLIEAGKSPDTNIALLENVSFADQKVTLGTLSDFATGDMAKLTTGPGITIIGKVVEVLNKNSSKKSFK